jgi:hypothetical protein
MDRGLRFRYRVECALAAISGAAMLLTLLVPTWFERTTGLEPDGGSGGTEWGIVAGLAAGTALVLTLARRDRRALRALAERAH